MFAIDKQIQAKIVTESESELRFQTQNPSKVLAISINIQLENEYNANCNGKLARAIIYRRPETVADLFMPTCHAPKEHPQAASLLAINVQLTFGLTKDPVSIF